MAHESKGQPHHLHTASSSGATPHRRMVLGELQSIPQQPRAPATHVVEAGASAIAQARMVAAVMATPAAVAAATAADDALRADQAAARTTADADELRRTLDLLGMGMQLPVPEDANADDENTAPGGRKHKKARQDQGSVAGASEVQRYSSLGEYLEVNLRESMCSSIDGISNISYTGKDPKPSINSVRNRRRYERGLYRRSDAFNEDNFDFAIILTPSIYEDSELWEGANDPELEAREEEIAKAIVQKRRAQYRLSTEDTQAFELSEEEELDTSCCIPMVGKSCMGVTCGCNLPCRSVSRAGADLTCGFCAWDGGARRIAKDRARQYRARLFQRKLRAAGLLAKCVRCLDRERILIKVRAPLYRLEIEAEKVKLRLRKNDGTWGRFRRSRRDLFISESDPCLFKSSDRQYLIDRIMRSPEAEGGAGLGEKSPFAESIEVAFPLHMQARLDELRQDWLSFWAPMNDDTNALAMQVTSQLHPTQSQRLMPTRSYNSVMEALAEPDLEEGRRTSMASALDWPAGGTGAEAVTTPPNCVTTKWNAACLFVKRMFQQPLDRISSYFGEAVAFYFAWLRMCTHSLFVMRTLTALCPEFYTLWLVAPALVGLILFIAQLAAGTQDHPLVPLYSLFIAVWSTLFLEFWKRRSNELAQRWGVLNIEVEEVYRTQFYGITVKADGQTDKYYPAWKRGLKYLCSAIVCGGAMVIVSCVMVYIFQARDDVMDGMGQQAAAAMNSTTPVEINLSFMLQHSNNSNGWLALLFPSIMYGAMIPMLDWVFVRVARALADWENHRTESSYTNSIVWKVFPFRFFNAFVSLYYYAFSSRHSLLMLGVQLASFMIASQAWNTVTELIVPCLHRKWAVQRGRARVNHSAVDRTDKHTRSRLRQALSPAWLEGNLGQYDPAQDYTEMMLQFGFVTYFSMSFPLAPLVALAGNLVEMRTDAYKLCFNTRRSIARKVGGIGVWLKVLQLMSLLSVVTNCLHMAFTSTQLAGYIPFIPVDNKIAMVFVFEHSVLAVCLLISVIIPHLPERVRKLLELEAARS